MADLLRTSAAALAALALAGCGGGAASSSDRVEAASAPDSAAPSPASTPAAASKGGSPATVGAGTGAVQSRPSAAPASGAPAASGTSAAPSPVPTHIILDAALSATCVTPGSSLTLTVQRARAGMQVIFNTTYADGKDGTVHGGVDSTGRRTDSTGAYTQTWVVKPLAPTGQAELRVGAVDARGYGDRTLAFRVARSC